MPALPKTLARSVLLLLLCVALGASACASSADSEARASAESDDAPEPTTQVAAAAEPAVEREEDPTVAPEPTPPEPNPTADEGEEEADEPALSPRAGETIVWDDCDGVECAKLRVQVDYDDSSSGTIDIALTVHRSSGVDEEWLGYLLVNPGGPGGSGLEFAQDAADGGFTEAILDRFDIVGFDPRGVGLSEPLFSCGDGSEYRALSAQIVDEVDTDEEIALGEEIAALCGEAMGPVGNQLHTANVVRDMDEIRKALGIDQISYYGGSYGSAVGVWFATLFPDSVRAMVVDGAANPIQEDTVGVEAEVAEILEQAGAFETQLAAALAACADETCLIFNGGDPVAYLARAAAKADLVRAASPSGATTAALLGLITPLYSETRWPELYNSLFELVENDNGEPLATIAVEQLGEVAGTNITGQVNCLDSWVLQPELAAFSVQDPDEAAQVEARLAEELPLIGQFVADEFEPCPFLGDLAPEELDVPLDGSDVPILVIGNVSDPATPYQQSEELVQEVLANGYLLRVDHASHVVFVGGFNQCVNEYVEAMLIDQTPPSERLVECEREDAAEPTVDDVPEFMEQICEGFAAESAPDADVDTVRSVCSDVADRSIDEFGAEALLAILTGKDLNEDRINLVVEFIEDALVEAGIG